MHVMPTRTNLPKVFIFDSRIGEIIEEDKIVSFKSSYFSDYRHIWSEIDLEKKREGLKNRVPYVPPELVALRVDTLNLLIRASDMHKSPPKK